MAPWVGVARGIGGGGAKLLRGLGVGGVNGFLGREGEPQKVTRKQFSPKDRCHRAKLW